MDVRHFNLLHLYPRVLHYHYKKQLESAIKSDGNIMRATLSYFPGRKQVAKTTFNNGVKPAKTSFIKALDDIYLLLSEIFSSVDIETCVYHYRQQSPYRYTPRTSPSVMSWRCILRGHYCRKFDLFMYKRRAHSKQHVQ